MSLIDSSYGKANVKFLKVKRDRHNPKVQEVLQANCQVLLRGDFDVSYTEADNSPIVPTDTVKNTILIEAKNTEVWPIERFAAHLAKHFTTKYNHVSGVEVTIVQDVWTKDQKNVLTYNKPSNKVTIVSGIKDLKVMKSTGSMFYGYNECDYTTLKPTTDRILSTNVDASWKFESHLSSLDDVVQKAKNGLFDNVYESARKITLDRFAIENSPSVQATMYNMSLEILDAAPAVDTVSYELPNIHFILYNLEWKGINNDDLYYPSSDPNGLIKSTVGRKVPSKL
ncbi:urate oxidase [Candidozyma auris]|nr:urate oxidase [[Candida] auris]